MTHDVSLCPAASNGAGFRGAGRAATKRTKSTNTDKMEREATPPEPEEWGLWAARITVTLKGDGLNDDTAEAIITTHNEADDADNGEGWLSMQYNHRDEGRMERIEAKAYAEGHKYADALLAIASKMGLTLTAATDVEMEWKEEMSGPDPDRFRD